jgi:predicted RNase H-like HicB family nuclease
MLYPVYIHMGDDRHCHGVTIPDFPGCFSAADRWEDLPGNIQEAAECHFHGEAGEIPAPTPLEKLAGNPEYEGGVWMLVDIDLSRISTRAKRVNITLPENLLRRIDEYASAHGMNRSSFLARAAGDFMDEHRT